MKKRVLAMLLAMFMVLGMLPTAAFAAEEDMAEVAEVTPQTPEATVEPTAEPEPTEEPTVEPENTPEPTEEPTQAPAEEPAMAPFQAAAATVAEQTPYEKLVADINAAEDGVNTVITLDEDVDGADTSPWCITLLDVRGRT